MRTIDDITSFIAGQPVMMDIHRHVEALDLQDCWVGAGFVRNVIWDALHGRPWSPSYSDVDVVYFNPEKPNPKEDARIETALRASMPDTQWSVKNQARMHLANGDPPYADMADALRHWPETCTAVAVRSIAGRVGLLAPLGVSDLVELIVRPTPAFLCRMGIYQARVARKQWSRSWPNLSFYVGD